MHKIGSGMAGSGSHWLNRWARLASLVCLLWVSSHTADAQAQACTAFTVFNHPTYSAFRTNSASGSCVLPSGITMSWNHAGANRGLQSFGCTPYDPTYWMDGGTMTVTFSQAVNDVGFVIWGLDGTDTSTVNVGTSSVGPPQTLSNEFTDLCPGFSSGSAPTVAGNVIQGTGGGYFGQIGVRANAATPYTTLQLTITGGGGGFGLVGVASPTPIGPGGPPPPAAQVPIPTLSEWALVGLMLALAGVAAAALHRRRWH
jgi:hypothetical protein